MSQNAGKNPAQFESNRTTTLSCLTTLDVHSGQRMRNLGTFKCNFRQSIAGTPGRAEAGVCLANNLYGNTKPMDYLFESSECIEGSGA